ncbi:MAG: lanthionine synthetase LanC family protein [Gemmatimonadota bacterium]
MYEDTGHEAFREAAREAMEHENGLFDAAAGNWLDLREDAQPAFRMNWCHGAPGIGLARLGGLRSLDTSSVRRDVEAAIEATLRSDREGPDHLCCGELGRTELAGDRLGRSDLLDAGRARVERVVARAAGAGGFTLHQYLPRDVYMPGFFMGLAGVGYEILRAARPGLLPSVLLWE